MDFEDLVALDVAASSSAYNPLVSPEEGASYYERLKRLRMIFPCEFDKIKDEPLTEYDLCDAVPNFYCIPIVVWLVELDECGEPDYSTGRWLMFDGHSFSGNGYYIPMDDYGDKFIAYAHHPGI